MRSVPTAIRRPAGRSTGAPQSWIVSARLLTPLLAILCTLLASPVAFAQSSEDADAADETNAQPTPTLRDEVELTIAKVGPGNRARAGSWAGVLIEYRDSALSPREIVLRITGVDRDGDPPAYERTVVGDPERPRSAWLYLPLPAPSQQDRLAVTAHEAIENADGFTAGRILGRTIIETSRLVQGESKMMGVVGTRDAGLRQYNVAIATSIRHVPLGHATTEVVSGLTLRDIPDRWQGLDQFDVLVWSRGGPDTDPNALDADRARAIREWVSRGGHLVVLLPPVGQAWTAGTGRNPLADLLPAVRIDRREGVPLEPYRPLISLDDTTRLPTETIVHTLTPLEGVPTADAIPVLAGPDGVPVVARRLIGTGMVTLIGLDITAESLRDFDALDAETIWHRVLGKRHALDTIDEVKDSSGGMDLFSAAQRRVVSDFDSDFEKAIDFTGDAGKGVLLGLAVFALYWLVAGPLGFFLLTRAGHRSRAWLAFLTTSAVFTAIAWAGATVLRPNSVRATHLTFIDAVYGTDRTTASTWLSVLVPSYGEAEIAVGEPGSNDLLSVWTPPPPALASGGFPDNRGYIVSARAPSEIEVPVRSTIKQIAAKWSGEPIAGIPRPLREPGEPGEPRLEFTDADAGRLAGALIHDLPGELTNILVVVVPGQRPLQAPDSVTNLWMPARIFMDAITDPWAPGQRLDMAQVTEGTPGERSAFGWLTNQLNIGAERSFGPEPNSARGNPADRYAALGFLDMLGPPQLLQDAGSGNRSSPITVVRTAHGLDLSRWFTQPCVIIVGTLEQTEGDLPIPLTVNGDTVPAKGTTVVRWVYPIDPAPPTYTERDP